MVCRWLIHGWSHPSLSTTMTVRQFIDTFRELLQRV